eukprot:CAMPEP_0172037740 /NCGR_PEP_ID=MMETSP1041-20130122/22920_1 /TAXON_ID=464988 /ORGANISM="Hemiselmis andersenii, Strain CCMP439" /LENGTH=51 /DNA_ID=CAMNT_0012695179 /DNA_START=153 /DNA_END=305 /DNA_ORIENTATION=-
MTLSSSSSSALMPKVNCSKSSVLIAAPGSLADDDAAGPARDDPMWKDVAPL